MPSDTFEIPVLYKSPLVLTLISLFRAILLVAEQTTKTILVDSRAATEKTIHVGLYDDSHSYNGNLSSTHWTEMRTTPGR